MRPFPLTLLCLAALSSTRAGFTETGQPCNQANNRLQVGTYQFWSECVTTNFCSDKGVCEPRQCRKDDFPFGYSQDSNAIPPKCPGGQFCTDEGSECQVLLPVGSPCQMNRDDQCEAPPNFKELADTSGRGLNVNGSVCLNNVCMWANATLNNPCVVENTAYIAYEVDDEFINIVSRGNCVAGLYCDAVQKVCLSEKAFGASCTADKECLSWNCLASGVCGTPAAEPHHFGVWVYIIVALGIFGGMFGTLIGLFAFHRKRRDADREKRLQYWKEQNSFHQNLKNMREAARLSILSMNDRSNRSTLYSRDDIPMLQPTAQKASGLRNFMARDDDSDIEERRAHDGDRF